MIIRTSTSLVSSVSQALSITRFSTCSRSRGCPSLASCTTLPFSCSSRSPSSYQCIHTSPSNYLFFSFLFCPPWSCNIPFLAACRSAPSHFHFLCSPGGYGQVVFGRTYYHNLWFSRINN